MAVLQTISTTLPVLFNCYCMGKYKKLKSKSYQHHRESSQMPVLARFLVCWKIPFLVSHWKLFYLKEEELKKSLELQIRTSCLEGCLLLHLANWLKVQTKPGSIRYLWMTLFGKWVKSFKFWASESCAYNPSDYFIGYNKWQRISQHATSAQLLNFIWP